MRLSFMLLSLCLLGGIAKAEDHIGSVSEPFYQGAIGILPQSSGTEALNYSVRVYPKEIVDASTGRTSLSFNDGTTLLVGAGSKVTLDAFVFDPKSGTLAGTLNFGAGLFRYASGTLAKHNNLKLNTPVVSMSIRGTKLVIRVGDSGETRVDVIDGAIGVIACPAKSATASGVAVQEGQAITVDAGCRVSVIGVSDNPQHEKPSPTTAEQSTVALSAPSPAGPAGGGASDPPAPSGGGGSNGGSSGSSGGTDPPGGSGGDGGSSGGGTKPGNGFGDKSQVHSGPPGQSGSHGNNGQGHGTN